MHWNAIYFCVHSKDLAQGVMKGKVVDRISAVEQSSVYVKKVGVGCFPMKARADEGTRRGCRMIWRRLDQSCHLGLDSRQ